MTDPITPPPKLVQQWCHEDGDEIKTSPRWYQSVCAKAARWGADQELEACCESLYNRFASPVHQAQFLAQELRDWLRAARRPKPPSLKEQALAALGTYIYGEPDPKDKERTYNTIRRALSELPND